MFPFENAIANAINFLFSPASLNGPAGFHLEGPFLYVESVFLAFIIFSVASMVWIYKDARKRGKSGFVALLFIFLTGWPASFIWWFWLRPPFKLEK